MVNETINQTGFFIKEYVINSSSDLYSLIFLVMVLPLIFLYLVKEPILNYFSVLIALIGGVVILISDLHPLFFLIQLVIIIVSLVKVVDEE